MAKKKNKSKAKTTNSAKAVKTSDPDVIKTDVITAALSTISQSILKVCRLCESKDGPFHNIFDSEKVTAKKIEELMPFWVAENDDLPHKICFRCSAKVEELYEFVQKCVGTQENLRKAIGKNEPLPMKKKTRALWEQSLNKSNMSNDDICHALIIKAMEGIKDIVKPSKDIDKTVQTLNSKVASKPLPKEPEEPAANGIDEDVIVTEVKCSKKDDRYNMRPLSSNRNDALRNNGLENASQPLQTKNVACKQQTDSTVTSRTDLDIVLTDKNKSTKDNEETNSKPSESTKSFDIMEHVTMIKVHGVGVLYQCKLCNRNFLKKEVVLSHGCAKTGVPKIGKCKIYVPPEPQRVNTVKYINTRIGVDTRSQQVMESKPATENENTQPSNPKENVKKKIGPASKTGRRSQTTNHVTESEQSCEESTKIIPHSNNENQQTSSTKAAEVSFLAVPNLSSRYKILPGPNNSFTLVEDKTEKNSAVEPNNLHTDLSLPKTRKSASPVIIDLEKTPDENNSKNVNKNSKKSNASSRSLLKSDSNKEKCQTDRSLENRPYPVGLFQTNAQAPFTTPAMKKQSYTIVQTGNPNKLLISTKSQESIGDLSIKRIRKTKASPATDCTSKEPFSVILEDTTPPKDSFFTFINVDPLLQPSYVLPTNSIIQESQITTSTAIAKTQPEGSKDKYRCNICGESFNREKKLSAHINTHYNVHQDYVLDDGPPTKRGKK